MPGALRVRRIDLAAVIAVTMVATLASGDHRVRAEPAVAPIR